MYCRRPNPRVLPLSVSAPMTDLPKSKKLAIRLRLSLSRQDSLQSSLQCPVTGVLLVGCRSELLLWRVCVFVAVASELLAVLHYGQRMRSELLLPVCVCAMLQCYPNTLDIQLYQTKHNTSGSPHQWIRPDPRVCHFQLAHQVLSRRGFRLLYSWSEFSHSNQRAS